EHGRVLAGRRRQAEGCAELPGHAVGPRRAPRGGSPGDRFGDQAPHGEGRGVVKSWTDWEIVRAQVAIGGRVVDEQDRPVGGAQVVITAMPEEFRRRIEGRRELVGGRWDRWRHRSDVTRAGADGTYYFLDLPPGKYTVKGGDGRPRMEAEQTVS